MVLMGLVRLLSVYLLLGFITMYSQTEPYLIKNVTLQSGLPQNTVRSILQDKKGYLWFCTTTGLNRYDGYDFNPFVENPKDSNSISSSNVVTLFEDSKGIFWIGTNDGVLNRYDRTTGIFNHFDLRLSDKFSATPESGMVDIPVPLSRYSENTITSIQEDKEGNLWIGTWGTGVIKFDRKTFRHRRYIEQAKNEYSYSLYKNNVKSIFIDSDGNVWIASMFDGLKKLLYDKLNDKIRFVRYTLFNGRYKQVTSIIEDSGKNLIIGTFDGGLFKLPANKKNQNKGSLILNSIFDSVIKTYRPLTEKIMTMLSDKYGIIWIGCYGALLKYDSNKNEIIRIENLTEDGVNNPENILSIYEDRTGIIWIGFNIGGGVSKIEYNKIKFNLISKKYPLRSSLNNEIIWSLLLDERNTLWIGTDRGGLNKFDRNNKTFSYFKNSTGNNKTISDNCVRAIKEDKWGDLWLGTYSGGLNHFNRSTGEFKSFKFDSNFTGSISHNQVQAIYIDTSSTFWIGTFGGGLNKFQIKKRYGGERISFTKYKNDKNNPFSLSSNKVYTIYEDKKGTIWIGTFQGGLNKFDRKTGRFIAYRNIPGDETSLEDDNVLAIYEDSKNNLWIATYGGGLNRFDPTTEKFVRYHNENMSSVYAVIEDESNNLWLSTDKGIFKFNYNNKKYFQYHLNDGLQNLEFSGGAYFKSKKGEIFFGGTNGINYFFPKNISDNVEIPPVVISNIRVFNESIKAEKEVIELSYSDNFVSFEFASLDFTNPADNRYSYKLEGYNDNWSYIDAKARIANYINLAPGTYIFRVKGTNSDDVWNEEGASVTLIIKPLYWQTTWFRVLSILAFIGILYYLFTLRYKGLLEMEKLKTQIAADLHDNVGAGLTEISILSELTSHMVNEESSVSAKNLSIISEKSRGLVDSMSDIVWVVNPKRDSLYDLILRLKDSYSDTFTAMGIAFKTNNFEDFSSIKLPIDYKQNLYLIFKEAINNSIKHSKCKQISLNATIEKDRIELILTDDGIGFNAGEKMKGNGITNIKNRSALVKGTLELISSNEGTSIKFTGKINRTDKIRLLLKRF